MPFHSTNPSLSVMGGQLRSKEQTVPGETSHGCTPPVQYSSGQEPIIICTPGPVIVNHLPRPSHPI